MGKMSKDTFMDLGRSRRELIREMVEEGLREYEEDPRKQRISIWFARPVLEELKKVMEEVE